jgi:hypothetical protein
MSVTSVTRDGWAIQHTNLGTVKLVGVGDNRTQVSVLAHPLDRPEAGGHAALLDRFASRLRRELERPDEAP